MGATGVSAVRSTALGVAAAAAVLVAYTVGAGSDTGVTSAAAAPPEGNPPSATIAMTGTGETVGIPDQVSFRLTVVRKAGDVATALEDANATMRRVLGALGRTGVARKDVQTTGLAVRPDYDYSSSGPPVLTGYVVTESASVTVRELRASGAVLTAATSAGGNAVRVSGLALRIGDREALMDEAREAAVAQARAKADQYAAATGQSLGRVLSLREVRARGARDLGLRMERAALFDNVAGSVPVRAGSEDLQVRVAVVWQLD